MKFNQLKNLMEAYDLRNTGPNYWIDDKGNVRNGSSHVDIVIKALNISSTTTK